MKGSAVASGCLLSQSNRWNGFMHNGSLTGSTKNMTGVMESSFSNQSMIIDSLKELSSHL
jgi:hypothetical protein